MAEYIEREALLKILRGSAVGKYPASFYMGLFAAADEVAKIHAADVAPVLRCKDCTYRVEYFDSGKYVCTLWQCRCCGSADYVKPDDFCSYGERRGDG